MYMHAAAEGIHNGCTTANIFFPRMYMYICNAIFIHMYMYLVQLPLVSHAVVTAFLHHGHYLLLVLHSVLKTQNPMATSSPPVTIRFGSQR